MLYASVVTPCYQGARLRTYTQAYETIELLMIIESCNDQQHIHGLYRAGTSQYMLNKNTWGVKKCEANQKQRC